MAVESLMHSPFRTDPTPAHRLGVHLFDPIVTSNFDDPFERAIALEATGHVIVDGELPDDVLPTKCLMKMHGSAKKPGTMVLTEEDVSTLSAARRSLWTSIIGVLHPSTVVALGTSLRDRAPAV